jgi:hypothetical protein
VTFGVVGGVGSHHLFHLAFAPLAGLRDVEIGIIKRIVEWLRKRDEKKEIVDFEMENCFFGRNQN